jgi:hypothetical protein
MLYAFRATHILRRACGRAHVFLNGWQNSKFFLSCSGTSCYTYMLHAVSRQSTVQSALCRACCQHAHDCRKDLRISDEGLGLWRQLEGVSAKRNGRKGGKYVTLDSDCHPNSKSMPPRRHMLAALRLEVVNAFSNLVSLLFALVGIWQECYMTTKKQNKDKRCEGGLH